MIGAAEMIDYSSSTTTPDQQRIEAVLDAAVGPDSRVLHVGIGNSLLAVRFTDRVALIDGITASENEARRASASSLSNYRVLVGNKYAPSFAPPFRGPYDFIIDNNITSFACCREHVDALLRRYRDSLAPAGVVLTDREGMAWATGDPRWAITPSDLRALAAEAGLAVRPLSKMVMELRRDETHG